jgi:hypothetical protein
MPCVILVEDLETIDIMTDARHGWHNNAKDTSVVAIGEKTHKVLKCEHVTKNRRSCDTEKMPLQISPWLTLLLTKYSLEGRYGEDDQEKM